MLLKEEMTNPNFGHFVECTYLTPNCFVSQVTFGSQVSFISGHLVESTEQKLTYFRLSLMNKISSTEARHSNTGVVSAVEGANC